ncbi:MAG: hypothetical protein ABI534_05550 [Chloroflexota bacterium]
MALLRRAVVLGFGVVQLILVARVLIDLGVLPDTGAIADFIVPLSDAVAAPVAGIAASIGGGFGSPIGGGVDPAIVAGLIGWTLVEGLVMSVLSRF